MHSFNPSISRYCNNLEGVPSKILAFVFYVRSGFLVSHFFSILWRYPTIKDLNINEQIPEDLYMAVAEVFAFIYSLEKETTKKDEEK